MDRSGFLPQGRRSAAGMWLALWFLAGESMLHAQISPGELSNSHRSMDGSLHCTDCHDTGKRPPQFKCLACHRDIRERLDAGKGLHVSLVGRDRTGRNCVQCHNEHHGRDFNLIRWTTPIRQFDHRKTGYLLEGKHVQLECNSCHTPERIPKAARQSILVKDLSRTYLGLSTDCVSCHTDAHQGHLSMECQGCHDVQDWKRPARFDHRKARFNPDGAHGKVACAKCHIVSDPAKPATKYRNLPFEDCSPCHRDPHAGSFKESCRNCHSARTSWAPMDVSAVFNHARTRFPLSGKHSVVPCKDCHSRGDFSKPVAFADCRDCHKKDPHRGQFASMPRKGACDNCHTVDGFKPAVFDIAQHSTTRFPLQESHAKVPCGKCHTPNTAGGVVYQMENYSCVACHRDIHEAQFAGELHKNKCEFCHNQSVFKPSTYTAEQHSSTRFPLLGGHSKPECSDCHKPGAKAVKFRFDDRSCTVCHEDPHNDQFAAWMAATLTDNTVKGCEVCHTINAWNELDRFDHAKTRFRLEGGHRDVACEKCHHVPPQAAAKSAIDYKAASDECSGCHEDPHEGQFAVRLAALMEDGKPAGCGSCHTVASWREMDRFDHSATDFPLEGAHRDVACVKCHKRLGNDGGGRRIRYVETPSLCSECHEDIHRGQFVSALRTECTECHEVGKWKPSRFNHEIQSSFGLSGAHRNLGCGECHKDTKEPGGTKFTVYRGTARNCSACHGSETGNQP